MAWLIIRANTPTPYSHELVGWSVDTASKSMETRVYRHSSSSKPLSLDEAEAILLYPQNDENIIKEPPVKPKGGDMYLFDYSDNEKKRG